MNVGDVRNRNQPNVQNAAQPLEGRMGSRLCNFATGLAIVGMQPANNHEQPWGGFLDSELMIILKYNGIGVAIGAPLGALLAPVLDLDPVSGAYVGGFAGSCVASWAYCLNKINRDNRHEAQD